MSEPCGHNSYWMTAYQNCVMCENAALRARIAKLRTALEACIDGFGRPDRSSPHVRSQVYALLAKLKKEAQP